MLCTLTLNSADLLGDVHILRLHPVGAVTDHRKCLESNQVYSPADAGNPPHRYAALSPYSWILHTQANLQAETHFSVLFVSQGNCKHLPHSLDPASSQLLIVSLLYEKMSLKGNSELH